MATQTGSIDLKGMTSAYSDQQQYFWVESNRSATWGGGAHITNIAESEFKTAAGTWGTDPTAGGYNLLMNTDTVSGTGSLQLRSGALSIMSLDNDSLDFNVIDINNNTYTTVATFGESTQIGKIGLTHITIDEDSIEFWNGTDRIGYVALTSSLFPTLHVTDSLQLASDYVWRKTPDGALGLYWK